MAEHNRMVISNNGVTMHGDFTVGSNELDLTGSTITGLSYNSLTDRPDPVDISGKQDTLPTLTAGQTWVGPSFTATDIATQAELNAHTHPATTPPSLASLLPTGAAWTENTLRIGNGNSILQAGDATSENLIIRTGGNAASNNRMTISNTQIEFHTLITVRARADFRNTTLFLAGATIDGLSYNSLTDRPTIPDISGKQDTLPTLAAGQSWVGASYTATDIATQAELDAHTHPAISLSSLLPTGGAWAENSLRIGNGSSIFASR